MTKCGYKALAMLTELVGKNTAQHSLRCCELLALSWFNIQHDVQSHPTFVSTQLH